MILETVFTVLTYVITIMIVKTNLMNVPIDQNAMIGNLEIAKDESIGLRNMYDEFRCHSELTKCLI